MSESKMRTALEKIRDELRVDDPINMYDMGCDALKSPTIPEGYALVPIEPTSKMLEAAQLADGDHGDHEDWLGFQWEMGIDQVWSAMLEAAKEGQS